MPIAAQHPLNLSALSPYASLDLLQPQLGGSLVPRPKPISAWPRWARDPIQAKENEDKSCFCQLLEQNKLFNQQTVIWKDTGLEVQAAIVQARRAQEQSDGGRE